MTDTVVIIPSRLKARRLPNKPIKLINGKEMILHVYEAAKNSNVADVLVVTPDKIIADIIKKNGGDVFFSKKLHDTGTDRVYEGFKYFYSSKPKIIINLQGDMPNINPKAITQLNDYIQKNSCDMCTLASSIKNQDEIKNKSIVKIITKNNIENSTFSNVLDFKRDLISANDKFIYHHIGIYAFTKEALMRYVKLKRSKLEIERDLEQMRALEDKMRIHAGYTSSNPLGVDTNEDLKKVKKEMETNE